MTVKQAIYCMKFNCEESVCEECEIYGTVGTDHCFQDACREAIKALEKQIPRRIKVINSIHHYCPSCDLYFDSRDWKSKYCGRCGQAIKWE